MSFWNPARMSEDRQLELDKRVILGIAEDKLKKDLEKVEKKIESHRNKNINIDVFSITRKQGANMNARADNLAFERNEILRRLDLIKEAKEG
ncbi:hypothetical protein PMY12_18625 [Clostridium tertium]|uniref:hypothetical protein n=1 Tax=Clostridium tertium TaxID=1559 RepID=UPI0023310162|nr:hypothetical protein [Clostridium tertium]MDB1935256.1 hypothetical protein [Clostridium tertium]MDB1939024.1 hypothetical protein [Clostridium tertium]